MPMGDALWNPTGRLPFKLERTGRAGVELGNCKVEVLADNDSFRGLGIRPYGRWREHVKSGRFMNG